MFQITTQIYNRIAVELQNHTNHTNIFSGNIEFVSNDGIEVRFVATIIPYYHREEFPEGIVDILYNIIPVWWELHTTTSEGELLNDFDFETLKFLTCQQ